MLNIFEKQNDFNLKEKKVLLASEDLKVHFIFFPIFFHVQHLDTIDDKNL